MDNVQFYINCVHFFGELGDYRNLSVIFVKPKLVDSHCYTLRLCFGISTVAHDDNNKLTFFLQTVPSSGSNIIVSYALFDTAFQLSCCDVM
jgi:hypothetical protein